MGPLVHRIHGALGSESLWGLKFIESMGPWVHTII